jgi:hypothetical protein
MVFTTLCLVVVYGLVQQANIWLPGQAISPANGWYPFFYDWTGLYERGIIDGSEWKANRFRFFGDYIQLTTFKSLTRLNSFRL